jgi:cytochrome P450
MPTAGLAPLDETITIEELTRDPYPIYKRLRREAPVLRVKSVGRTFLTKAADTKYVKDNAALFSSDDPNTPMKRAFLAHTLMRKDHDEHRTERIAIARALSCFSLFGFEKSLFFEIFSLLIFEQGIAQDVAAAQMVSATKLALRNPKPQNSL